MTAAARKTDPITSHYAAQVHEKSGKAATQRAICLEEVNLHPGQTSAEIAKTARLDRYTPSRRLPELRTSGKVRNGEIRKCLVQDSMCQTWYPVIVYEQGNLFEKIGE